MSVPAVMRVPLAPSRMVEGAEFKRSGVAPSSCMWIQVRGRHRVYACEVIAALRRVALPIALVTLVVNLVMLVVSAGLWWLAISRGWLDSVTFVSHVSMLALVFSAVSGIAAGIACVLALVPTDGTEVTDTPT